jgi:hypothetical protein
MVNRRSLVVGGGAAALVAATAGLSPAAAARVSRMSTAEHARRVLGSLNVDRGLVDLAGAQGRLKEGVASYLESAPRDPNANDVYAWTQQRVRDLTGRPDVFGGPLFEHPQTRALLAFAFALYTQHQDVRLPVIVRSMPVPVVLAKLEPDFFPELLRQLEAEGRGRPGLDRLLQAGSAELDRIVGEIAGDLTGGGGDGDEPSAARPTSDLLVAAGLSLVVGVIVFINETIKED